MIYSMIYPPPTPLFFFNPKVYITTTKDRIVVLFIFCMLLPSFINCLYYFILQKK
ncbi:hypothetical protein BDC45DRAFT_525827 [Circinella umbellata]|nr:hypothetical protein BDC45DRAFT_525827 [Circinella umbellata]